MSKNHLKDITPASFAVLSALTGLSWGAVAGLGVFVAGFLSDSFAAFLPQGGIAGVPSAVALLFLVPATLGSVGFIAGYLSFPVFRMLIGAVGGVSLEADIASELPVPAPEARPPARSPGGVRRGL